MPLDPHLKTISNVLKIYTEFKICNTLKKKITLVCRTQKCTMIKGRRNLTGLECREQNKKLMFLRNRCMLNSLKMCFCTSAYCWQKENIE